MEWKMEQVYTQEYVEKLLKKINDIQNKFSFTIPKYLLSEIVEARLEQE